MLHRGAILVLTAFGLLASAALAREAYQHSTSGQGEVRAIGGVPFHFLVLAWFVLVLALQAAAIARALPEWNVGALLFWLSLLVTAPVFYLTSRLFVEGNVRCLLCWLSYMPILGILCAASSYAGSPKTSVPTDVTRLFTSVAGLATVGLCLLLAALAVVGVRLAGGAAQRTPRQASPSKLPEASASVTEFRKWWADQPRLSPPGGNPTQDSAVVVLKFHDYQCPPCRQAFYTYRPILEKYARVRPGAIRVEVRDFPLDPECNPSVRAEMHPAACEAAAAVYLAKQLGQGDAMVERLFAEQPSLTPETVWQLLVGLGIRGPADPRYIAVLEHIRGDTMAGRELGVDSTPTFFVGGVRLNGVPPGQHFEAAIEYELERVGHSVAGVVR